MGGLIQAALTGLGEGYLQNQKERAARERQQRDDTAQERARRLVIYKMIAATNPEAANAAITRDPLFADFVKPVLDQQGTALEAQRAKIMAETNPEGPGNAAAAAVKQPRLTLPTPANAYGPGYGPQAEAFINSSPLYRQQRLDALGNAQAAARQKSAEEVLAKREGLLAALPTADVAQVFRTPPSIKAGRAGQPIYDTRTGEVVGYLPVSQELQDFELNKIDRRTAGQKEVAALNAGSRERVAQIGAGSRESVAGINASSRETVAGTNASSRERVASINAKSREDVARLVNDTRQEVARLRGTNGSKPITQKDYTATKVKITNDIAKVAHAIKQNQDPTMSYASEAARTAELSELQRAQQALKQELTKWETAWQKQQTSGGGGAPQPNPAPKSTPAPSGGGLLTKEDLGALMKAYQAEQAKKTRR